MLLELPWDQWPCAGGLSVVTPLERNCCERLTRWRFSGAYTTPWRKAGGKRGAREYAPDSAWAWRMSGLARDGTAEPLSRDQILRRERGRGKKHFFPVQRPQARLKINLLNVMTNNNNNIATRSSWCVTSSPIMVCH